MKGIVYRNHRKDPEWAYSRYTLANDRITPGYVAKCVEEYGSVDAVMRDFKLSRDQVETSLAWLAMKRKTVAG